MKIKAVIMLFFCTVMAIAEESDGVYQARMGQRIAELELDDLLSLWITDADTGLPVEGVLVAIEDAGSVRTDKDGLAVFPVLDDGKHNFIMQKDGYIIVKEAFTVFGGSLFFNKYSLPKLMPPRYVKIVLDWGDSPDDLDAHLIKKDRYHISYRDMKSTSDGSAWLDRDDRDKYGPETITITELDRNTQYRYYVYDYSNRNVSNSAKLSISKAVVRVYTDNRLAYIFTVRPNNRGATWNVFEIDNGVVKSVDTYE